MLGRRSRQPSTSKAGEGPQRPGSEQPSSWCRSRPPGSVWASEPCRRWLWGWCSRPALSCTTTTALVSTWTASASKMAGADPSLWAPQGAGALGSEVLRQRGEARPSLLAAFVQIKSVLCFTVHQPRASSCPPCAPQTSASVPRVRGGLGGAEGERRPGWGWGGGRLQRPIGLIGPLSSGKCPRQRRALERGVEDKDGYRMKFACYYPRVEYG